MHATNSFLRLELDRIDRTRRAARHLAMACRMLALFSGTDPLSTARFKSAEARFRSLADADPMGLEPALAASPAVDDGSPDPTPLVDLLELDDAGGMLPARSLDPDLIDLASRLLREFDWTIPNAVA